MAVVNKNPISRLQEISQQWKFPIPTYREGEGSFDRFGSEITIKIMEDIIGFHAFGRTKKESKANVAQKALDFIEEHYPKLLQPPSIPVSEIISL